MELLKQPLGRPLSLADMVITLVVATGRRFMDIPVNKIKQFQMDMLEYINSNYAGIVSTIETDKVLEDYIREQILDAVDEFKKVNNG